MKEGAFENILGKKENAGNQKFLSLSLSLSLSLLPYQRTSGLNFISVKLSTADALKFIKSKVCHLGRVKLILCIKFLDFVLLVTICHRITVRNKKVLK